jgi:hypothetical protein
MTADHKGVSLAKVDREDVFSKVKLMEAARLLIANFKLSGKNWVGSPEGCCQSQ